MQTLAIACLLTACEMGYRCGFHMHLLIFTILSLFSSGKGVKLTVAFTPVDKLGQVGVEQMAH